LIVEGWYNAGTAGSEVVVTGDADVVVAEVTALGVTVA